MGGLWRRIVAVAAGAALAGGGMGCSAGRVRAGGDALVRAERIQILPFTKPVSFDEDGIPDGLEVLIQPVDRMGDPVKVAGDFVFELYTYRPASGEPLGRRLRWWRVSVADWSDQERFWDRTAQMYQFRLAVEAGGEEAEAWRGAAKLVLVATYNDPGGRHLSDEYIIDVGSHIRRLRSGLSGNS